MANPVLVGGTTVYLPSDLQKTNSDKNKSDAFSNFIEKKINELLPAKTYYFQFKWVFQDGTTSKDWSATYKITTPADLPKTPTGFTANSQFAGIRVTWTGAYLNTPLGKSFNGFKQVSIYAGTSATYSPTTSRLAGVIYSDAVNNSLNIPVDGTYVRYGQNVYIHALALNTDNVQSTPDPVLVATVSNGASRASETDLGPGAVTISKLKGDVLVFDNIVAGNLSASSFFRAGDPVFINRVGKVETANGARIEISSSTTNITSYPDPLGGDPITLTNPVLPGLTIYNTSNSPIFRATLNGQLTIGGYQPAGNYIGPGDVNANVTSVDGNKIKTGVIYSNGYIFANGTPQDLTTANGSGYSYRGTAINLDTGAITGQNIRITGSDQPSPGSVFIKGKLIAGNNENSGMRIGKDADGAGNDGIYIDPNDYWYGNGKFSFGNGKIIYNNSTDTLVVGSGSTNITVTSAGLTINVGEDGLDLSSISSNEDGTFGDTTLVRDSNNKMTIGRALFFKSTAPTNETARPGGGTAFNVGDFWFTTA